MLLIFLFHLVLNFDQDHMYQTLVFMNTFIKNVLLFLYINLQAVIAIPLFNVTLRMGLLQDRIYQQLFHMDGSLTLLEREISHAERCSEYCTYRIVDANYL